MELNFNFTKSFYEALHAYNDPNTRVIVSYGGTSSGKSIGILQLLTIIALTQESLVITIVGETFPTLRRGAIRDWKKIIMGDLFNQDNWNSKESYYSFPNTGSIIQFVSADNPDKFRGPRQDIVYFEEINNIKEEAYIQASIRTKIKVLCSFNPSGEFFMKDEMEKRNDIKIIHSTYKDNNFVSETIIKDLEQRALLNQNFKRVYVDGEWGSYEGLIFQEGKNWDIVNHFPSEFIWHTFGLDWGFTNDPTTIIEVAFRDNQLYLREHLYKKGLLNSQIAKEIKELNNFNSITADSAEPKSITELKRIYKINIKGAKKGKGSIMAGINKLLEYPIHIEDSSLNIIKEFRNYRWETDRNGKATNKPIDSFNHAIDALRYAIEDEFKPKSTISFYG